MRKTRSSGKKNQRQHDDEKENVKIRYDENIAEFNQRMKADKK